MPEHWATEDDGYLRLCVAKGTLVPAKTLRCGHPQASRTLDLLVSLCLNPNSNTRTHTRTPRPRTRLSPLPLPHTHTHTRHQCRSHPPLQPSHPNPLSPNPSNPRQASAKRRKLEQSGMSDPAAFGMPMHMHMHMGESGMHMPMGALGMPIGAMGMPVMNHSNYSPAGRRPGAPVKIVWSVEEDQQLLQVLCMLHLALRGTPLLHHHRVHSTWRVKGWSRQGALAAALGPCIWCIVRPLVLSCLLPPPSWQLVHTIGPRWSAVAAQLPGRVGKQCRERCVA